MIRFLKSIGIEDTEDFDLDFQMISRDRFNKEQLNMILVKDTPWEYSKLQRFQEGLMKIDYKYSLSFSYKKVANSNQVHSLLSDWFSSIYRLPLALEIKEDDINSLTIVYQDASEKEQFESIIADFKDLLKFLCYEVDINEEVKQQEEVVQIDEEEKTEILEAATTIATEELNDENKDDYDMNDRNDIRWQIEADLKEKSAIVEDAVLKEMKKNAELMRIERKRMMLNKRGNYKYVEKIDDITGATGSVDFNGFVYSKEVVERGERKKLSFGVADEFGGAISCFCYQNTQINDDLVKHLDKSNVRIRGVAHIDDFSGNLQVKVHNIDLLPPDEITPEQSEEKRVELHLHTTMSTQDGVSTMDDYCSLASRLGHKAIAITDHGCVQGFPDAQKAGEKYGMKVLYGCEFYMIDDELVYVFNPNDKVLNKSSYVVFDLETTGLSARYDKIIEFGAVKVSGGRVVDQFDVLINPGVHIPEKITEITTITDEQVQDKPTIDKVLPKILEFIGDSILVTHNAHFDISFLNESLLANGYELLKNGAIDTLALSRYVFPDSSNHRLGTLCRRLEVKYNEDEAHRADYDAFVLSEVWHVLLEMLTKDNLAMKHKELANLKAKPELYKHLRSSHVIALAKNKIGIKNLFKLVSIANIDYFAGVPNIPRRILEQYHEGLLFGSACFNGDVFQTARYYNKNMLMKVCSFYDYIEVQTPENYSYLVNMGDCTQEEVYRYIKDIIDAAKEVGKPVVATGDVHYLSPKEKKFRDVYIYSQQVGRVFHPLFGYARQRKPYFENPDQHYRSTDEMLNAFAFLEDEALAKEIVIDNTNKIADMIEELKPVPNDKLYTPKLAEGADLRKLCFDTAHRMYGDPLPEVIQNRLDTELNGIISNGYEVIYYIAHELVKKSNEDGYIVGSRGSVGSSFAATMAGITEVNPLAPHYLCPHCKKLEWGADLHPEVKSGFDLPARKCPDCGAEMIRDGQNIPFETFLGFHAEKVPDIDLNFPGDYQARAHDYTKVLLGENNVYRAGTIETVADKTAFGFARGYVERYYMQHGMSEEEAKEKAKLYPKAKIDYLASGCVGVKRTTGQHPGGIVVIPGDHDVYDFTPIQWPADEVGSAWKTTHFDFHSIHDTILKLDMLGHVDPVALKMMCDLTHIDIHDIPLNDPDVISIFSSPKALKMHSDYLHQETGAMAIPEFGTDFVRGILEKTRPTSFSDLVIISGLSHGTNVWNGNAEKIIDDKTATLQEVIGCRDDIMTYLISKELPASLSFAIMEDVRKGKGLKPEYEEAMIAHNVPRYYIDSCKKIKYMFPKGHAVAYVTMAMRVGYFKVHYPLVFYATFFSVRSKQYDIVPMIKGEEAIINRLDFLKNKEKTMGEKLTTKEEDQYKTLQIALEMVQRGYKFSNIDLYRSDSANFVVDEENGALIPPFSTIDALGENNAVSVIEARKNGPFTSKEDLLKRTKLTSTNVNDLSAMGVLDGLSETDQLSLFDDWGF